MNTNYGGMTVNERLYVSGLLDKFDMAVQHKDKNAITQILEEVGLPKSNIDSILSELNIE